MKKHHTVEIFSADCPLCRETIQLVKEADCCKNSEIVVHTCNGEECCAPAKKYSIQAVPSIVVDGTLALQGKPTLEQIQQKLGAVCSS